jgi:hypothetical protein
MAVRWRYPVGPNLGFVDGAAATTAVLTDITPGTEPPQPPPIWEKGMRLLVEAHGNLTTGTTGNNVQLGLYLGAPATVIGTALVLAISAAITSVVSLTNAPWELKYEGEIRALSTPASATAGSIQGRGKIHMPASLTQFQAPYALPGTHAGRILAFNSTLQQNLLVGCTWAAVTGGVSLICEHLNVELAG